MAKTNCVATRLCGQVRASRLLRNAFGSAILLLVLFFPAYARAMSAKDYEALSDREQSVYSGNFVAKMTADIGQTNPKLMLDIRDWFAKTPPGKRVPEGVEKFNLESWVLNDLAKKGKPTSGKSRSRA